MNTAIQAPATPGSTPSFNTPTRSFFEDPLKIQTILVPLDFSEESLRALDYAGPLAKHFGAAIHLVYVYEGEHQFSSIASAIALISGQWMASKLQTEGQHRVPGAIDAKNCHVRSGRPFQEIAASAKELKADLIVIASHGYTGYKHLTFGSTAEHLLQYADCPMLVVRPGMADPVQSGRQNIVLQKILVPVDFSPCAREGARYASVFATGVGADLLLAHVINPSFGPENGDGRMDCSQLCATARIEANDKLDQLVNFLPLVNISAETEVLIGTPTETLIEETKRADIDMVILATHGLTGLRYALLGSVAERMVRRASCPVLVVPSHERKSSRLA